MVFAPVATYSSFPAPPPARNTAYRAHLAAAGLSSRASSFAAGSGLAVAAASVAVAARPRRTGAGGGALGCKCLFGLGVPEMVVIAGVAALLFGPKQLPEIGRSVGKTVKSFQQAAKEFETELKKDPEDGGKFCFVPTPQQQRCKKGITFFPGNKLTRSLSRVERKAKSEIIAMALPLLASPLKTLNPALNPSPTRRRRLLLSSPQLSLPPALSRSGRLRCSAGGYGDAASPQQAAPTTPRPDEIPWSKDLCNSVRLIGTVGTDIELRQLPSGASVARGRIAVWKSATETTWVTLAFWEDLAVTASEHVKQGDKIFVSGRLVSDTVDEGPEKRQVYYKVVVQEFKFIESFQPVRLYEPESNQDNQSGKHGNYVDNDSSGSTENRKGDYMNSSSRSTEALWQAFFANPVDWWDNRKDKKNPKYPDFKHKSTGEALWVDGRSNPNWVISQLAILDSRMGSLQDKERKPVSFMYSDDFMTSDANN